MGRLPFYDVVIAGAGPAGSTAAIVLARRNFRVLVVERRREFPGFKVGESLPPAAWPLLRHLGLDRQIREGGHLGCHGNRSLWGGEDIADNDFIRDPKGPGFHLDRTRFDSTLREASTGAGAETAPGWHVARCRRNMKERAWRLELTSGASSRGVRCRCLIDATGRAATISAALGSCITERDALVAYCGLGPAASRDHDARSLVESAGEGWWYSALLPGRRRLTVFFTDRDLPTAAEMRGAEGFLSALARTRQIPGWRRGHGVERIISLPSGTLRRSTVAGEGWFSIGDASLAMDPLSSQGLFHALFTGIRGAESAAGTLCGEPGAPGAWQARIEAIGASYSRRLAASYGTERRWPDAPFWSRRSDPGDRVVS